MGMGGGDGVRFDGIRTCGSGRTVGVLIIVRTSGRDERV